MREIVFRGIDWNYSKINGYHENVWRYGDLRHYDTGEVGIACTADRYGYGTITSKVIPETVCQYTGLTDKNGKKIFEGDKVYCRTGECCQGYHEYENTIVAEMGFSQGMWELLHMDTLEVIGNIHDKEEV